MAITAFIASIMFDIRFDNLAFNRLTVFIEHRYTATGDLGYIAFFKKHKPAGYR